MKNLVHSQQNFALPQKQMH